MNFPLARIAARLFPPAKPRLRLLRIKWTDGYSRATRSADPSDEPLSAMITSVPGGENCRRDSRQAGRYDKPL
jgi:hypothetical protein